MTPPMRAWYVIYTQPRAEMKAAHHLMRQGYEVFVPRFLKRRRHARRTDWLPSPIFPRYIFVQLDLEAVQWRPILSTVGVSYLICHHERPVPVPDGIIDALQSKRDADGWVVIKPTLEFKHGDRVAVIAGAFEDQIGLFDEMADHERVVILLNFMGRQVRTRLPLEVLRRAA